jgi:hypothetical protein
MNGGPARANQAGDGEKGLKQKLLQIESPINIIYSRNSPTSVAPDILGNTLCIYQWYILLQEILL